MLCVCGGQKRVSNVGEGGEGGASTPPITSVGEEGRESISKLQLKGDRTGLGDRRGGGEPGWDYQWEEEEFPGRGGQREGGEGGGGE